MKKFVLGAVVALVGFTLPLGMAGTQAAQAAGPVTTVFDSIPSNLPSNVPSLGNQAYQQNELGDEVRLAPGPRIADSVDVVMSSWTCETGGGATCSTTSGAFYPRDLTLTLYNVDHSTPGSPQPGSPILTTTQSIHIPYRPSYDPACGPAGTFGPWQDAHGDCFNGLAFTASFDLSSFNQQLPSDLIFGVTYNTQSYGPTPTGDAADPANSLNIGLGNGTGSGEPTVGTNVDTDDLQWNTETVGYYSTSCPGNTFCRDTGWTGYQPQVRIKTTANSVTSTTKVVDSTHPQGWNFDTAGGATQSLDAGPGSPPLGTGSLNQADGPNGDDFTRATNDGYNGTPLDEITSLTYSTYVSNNNGCQAPYLSLAVDEDNNGSYDNRLYFEPCYQTGGYQMAFDGSTIPDQGNIALNTWQTWDAASGGWWDVNGELSGSGGPPLITLADYLNAHPDAVVYPISPGNNGLRVLSGGGAGAWDNFVGASDALTIGVDNVSNNITETTYDFENGNVPSVTIDPTASVTEGDSGTTNVSIPVNISTASAFATDVHWSTSPGTATSPADYVTSSGTVHWDAGDTSTQMIQVPVNGDTLDEANETFTVTLDSPVNGTISGSGTSTVTINDDDNAPRATIHGKSQLEGDGPGNTKMKFKVSIPHPSGLDISVDYHTANGTAIGGQDFVKRHGTVTIVAGKRHVFIRVPIKGDTLVEPNESFSVGISNPVNTVIGNGAATGVILNDD